MKASLIAIVVLSVGTFAATPAEERALIAKVTRILKTEDGSALRQLVHWKGASPAAKEWFDLELGRAAGEVDWHVRFASAALALDMARVERARIVAFDDPELPPLDPATLARKSLAAIRLRLQPYITLLALTNPVDALLRKLRQSTLETASASNAVAANRRRPVLLRAKPEPAPIHLAIHRVDLSVYFKRLEPEAFTLLTELNSGASLEGACASAFAKSDSSDGEAAAKVREWFATLMELGWLCARSR